MSREERMLLVLGCAVAAWGWWATRAQRERLASFASGYTEPVREYVETAAQQVIESARVVLGALTRGERNNNPGNLRLSADRWQGLASVQSDPDFFVFADPIAGIRALSKTLLTYSRVHGLDTLTGILSRWAPGHENPLAAYISNVSQWTGFLPDEPLNLANVNTLERVASAIIMQENGRVSYPPDAIAAGVKAALA